MCDQWAEFDWLRYPQDQREPGPATVDQEEAEYLAALFKAGGWSELEDMVGCARELLRRPGIEALADLTLGDYGQLKAFLTGSSNQPVLRWTLGEGLRGELSQPVNRAVR